VDVTSVVDTVLVSTVEAPFSFTVLESNLVVVLNMADGVISNEHDLDIDGSLSYDPDNPAPNLSFYWSCVDCQDATGGPLVNNGSTSRLKVEKKRLAVGAIYAITLQITMGSRTAQKKVTLTVVDKVRPNLHLPEPSTRLHPQTYLDVQPTA
jgi:hypothetical protein